MKIIRSIFLLLLLSMQFACEEKCELKPISNEIFNLEKVPKTTYFSAGNEIDSLIVLEKMNSYEKSSFKSPMNFRECEHYKSYVLMFRDDRITIAIRKNDQGIIGLEIYAFGSCNLMSDQVPVTERELVLNKEFTLEKETNCDGGSSLKKIVLQGYLIKSFTTSDNKVWTSK